jgi:hypothetical protein
MTPEKRLKGKKDCSPPILSGQIAFVGIKQQSVKIYATL